MNNPQQSAKSFAALMRKIRKQTETPEPESHDDPVEVLVKSFLMWDTTTERAGTAYRRLLEQVVDFNDLRVSMPGEMVEWIGSRYPQAAERCQRLRAALRHTYRREHAVSLGRLKSMGRREVKQYLRSLDGTSSYVADRVTLVCFDAHCIPVDNRLRKALIAQGIGDEDVEVADLSSWLARQVKAADALATHHALQQWSDKQRPSGGTTRKTSRSTARKTPARARKTTAASRR